MNTPTTKAAARNVSRIAGVAVLGLLVQLGWLYAPALAQPPAGPEAAGCLPPNMLPNVPAYPPRPAEGTAPGQKWPDARQGKDRAPVAALVEPLRGNDAAIKIRVGQGRLLTFKSDIATPGGRSPIIALGDPTIADFVPIDSRRIRVVGRRAGSTDLSVIGADGQDYGFELEVLYDLDMVSAHLRQVFPNDLVRLSQMRSAVVVEGEVRSIGDVARILQIVYTDLQAEALGPSTFGPGGQPLPMSETPSSQSGGATASGQGNVAQNGNNNVNVNQNIIGSPESLTAPTTGPRIPIVNLLRVPGVHQVMLQVRVAELNRTALRRVGADILATPHGNLIGTNIAGSGVTAAGLLGLPTNGSIGNTTAFGIFPSSSFEILLNVLRENALLSIMAEPNLVAMSGMKASFLAGGSFPVPVPQGGTGATSVVTVQWQNFGVLLNFTPYVLSDDSIRLTVNPEVSSIDPALGTTLVAGGSPVPGLDSRSATTTVEMKEGQTLAIAGLLQVTLDANTTRIPFLGDLPYIGPLFSNTSHKRTEKELLVLVTPHLVAPLDPCQVPCLPGSDIKDPTDLEFYLKNRIEGHVDSNYRSTANWDQPLGCKRIINLEKNYVNGPVGFSQ